MLIQTNSYPRLEILGVSHFHQKERSFPNTLTCMVSCLPARLNALDDLTGLRTRHSQVNIMPKGFRYSSMSRTIVEKLDNNMTTIRDLERFPFSSSYETAMEALSSLITRRKRSDRSNISSKYDKLDQMLMYIKILGLEEHIAGLKIVHVAGTKGKGSTCTFCEAILRECGFRTGLFTSPHLIDVRERFRLNGLEISEEKFLLHFWDCWNQLKEKVTEDLPMPPLFQFLTVLAFKIFACEKVDVAIIEVGLGGTKDSTNVIEKPLVCGITSLGMDHMEILGDTLGQIASQKAGIFKPHVPAFTVPQLSEAMDVLQERADELMIPLKVAEPLDCTMLNGRELSLSGDHQFINAGLAVDLCKRWLQSTGNWEKLFSNDGDKDYLPEPFLRGLSTAQLSGRAQIVHDNMCNTSKTSESSYGELIFYLDGAHSPESMDACAKWFSNAVKINKTLPLSSCFKTSKMEEKCRNGYIQHQNDRDIQKASKQILLFNCMDVRNPEILLSRLVSTCASSGTNLSKAIFVPSISKYSKVTSAASAIPLNIPTRDLSWQFNIQRIWEKIVHGKEAELDKSSKMHTEEHLPSPEFLYKNVSDECLSSSVVIPTLPLTLNWLRDCVRDNPRLKIQVLVTGSLHLVGDVLKLLRK